MGKEENKKEISIGGIIAIIIIIVIIVLIAAMLVNKNSNKNNTNENTTNSQFELPDTEYKDMKVSEVTMEYLKDNNETMVTMLITNTTNNGLSDEFLTAYLLNGNEEVIGQTQTFIKSIEPNEEYSISVTLKGDLRDTKQIKLEKNQE